MIRSLRSASSSSRIFKGRPIKNSPAFAREPVSGRKIAGSCQSPVTGVLCRTLPEPARDCRAAVSARSSMMEDHMSLTSLPTSYLQRAKKELLNVIPGDPTAMAHVTTLLRELIANELNDPARAERDQAAVADLAAAQQERADAQRKAELDAATSDADKAALTARHEKETAQAVKDK